MPFAPTVGKKVGKSEKMTKRNPVTTVATGFLFGAGDEARTRYLDLGKVALYQMSYARRTELIIAYKFDFVNPVIRFFYSESTISMIPTSVSLG